MGNSLSREESQLFNKIIEINSPMPFPGYASTHSNDKEFEFTGFLDLASKDPEILANPDDLFDGLDISQPEQFFRRLGKRRDELKSRIEAHNTLAHCYSRTFNKELPKIKENYLKLKEIKQQIRGLHALPRGDIKAQRKLQSAKESIKNKIDALQYMSSSSKFSLKSKIDSI